MKEQILIVDDEKINLEILRAVLEDEYEIFASLDAEAAYEIAVDEKPDLILLDVIMPEMNGYELCKKLKNTKETAMIPVIFITSQTDVSDETEGFKAGAVDFINKPVQPATVKARIKTHLELKKAYFKLKEQNKKLIEAAELREDVERITRHDLKSPLDAVVGFPQLMLDDDNLTDDQISALKSIKDAGYRMLNMINRSLDLFKMERGLYKLQPTKVNLVELFFKIFKEEENLKRAKNLKMSLKMRGSDIDKESFHAAGEQLLCFSLFENLLRNAIEASPLDEQITVTFSKDAHHVITEIHNKGAIPDAIKEQFFEKYATEGKSNGTGLGTYSAQLITQIQNGFINFESSKEEGTTLFVKLPIYEETN